MKILVLFSGTGSIESVYCKTNDIRGLDIDNTFLPYYNIDILKWNYKRVFRTWIPDYIHASPPCTEFSFLKNGFRRDNKLGLAFLKRTLKIIEYVKRKNCNLKFTIENPKGLMKKVDIIQKYKKITTSYCMYGFPYKKETDFWYGGFDLVLRKACRNTQNVLDWCDSKKEFGCHEVRLGVSRGSRTHHLSSNDQVPDNEYWQKLKKEFPNKYYGYAYRHFRYRIPELLCKDIKKCIMTRINNEEKIKDIIYDIISKIQN